MAIDRMDWHAETVEEFGLPYEHAGTHIGIFLAWIIHNDLHGELHREESASAIVKVQQRQITGRMFLSMECDEKFWDEDLNEYGLAFTQFYYAGEDYLYYKVYEDVLEKALPSIYHVEDTWENYDLIAPHLTEAFRRWKETSV